MSRCYPFPPPGYEQTPRSDNVDLITKEKQKEKKPKKEKKDKEKRERKDRKDKNKNKDKHKEKKERKEKDKDERRHKERDKEKLSDGRKNEERTQGENEERCTDSSRKFEEVKNSKLAEELSERCRDNGASGRINKNFVSSNHKAEGLGAWASLGRELFHGNEVAANHISKNQNRSNGPSMDAENKLQGNEKASERPPLAVNLVSRDNTKYNEGARTMHKELVKGTEEKHEISEKNRMGTGKIQENQTRNNVLDQQMEVVAGKPEQKDDNNKPKKANLIVQDERRHETKWHTSNVAAMDIGGHEKSEDTEVDGGKSNHHRHKDQTEKKHKKKDKDKHKKRKEGKRDRHENKRKDDKKKDDQENGQAHTQDLVTRKDNENFRKRKDQEMNGLLHESELRPLKLPKPLPPSLPLHVENGRTVPLCGYADSKPGGMNCEIDENQAINHVNHKINGTPSVGSRSSVAANASQNHEVSLKPPHPDTKYLNIIYSVPKVEVQPEVDNQDWLYNRDVCRPKPKADVKIDEPTAQVWSKALRIQSPDVIALPYVIPY